MHDLRHILRLSHAASATGFCLSESPRVNLGPVHCSLHLDASGSGELLRRQTVIRCQQDLKQCVREACLQ